MVELCADKTERKLRSAAVVADATASIRIRWPRFSLLCVLVAACYIIYISVRCESLMDGRE